VPRHVAGIDAASPAKQRLRERPRPPRHLEVDEQLAQVHGGDQVPVEVKIAVEVGLDDLKLGERAERAQAALVRHLHRDRRLTRPVRGLPATG
jgi:hypothetical protein